MSATVEALRSRESTALSAGDSPAVFAAKSLLLPIIPVASLASCLALANAPLRGGYFLIAVLTFLGAPEAMARSRERARSSSARSRVAWSASCTGVIHPSVERERKRSSSSLVVR